MKKFTSLLVFMISLGLQVSNAQMHLDSAKAVNIHVVSNNDFSTKESTVQVINTGNTNLSTVIVERNEISMASGHESWFCWGGNCYPVTVSISPRSEPINSLDTNRHFIASLSPGSPGTPGTSIVDYSFYDNSGTSDTLTLRFTYDFTIGVNDLPANVFSVSAPYPNPADRLTSISYNLNTLKEGRLIFYNMLGSVIKEIKLNDRQKTLVIATSDFKSGVYFYSLIADGKSVASKKLIITHR